MNKRYLGNAVFAMMGLSSIILIIQGYIHNKMTTLLAGIILVILFSFLAIFDYGEE